MMRFIERKLFRLILITIQLVISIYSYSQYDSISFEGYNRTYLVHLPPSYTNTANLPLIIAMHGGLGNAYNLEEQSQLSLKADSENFIVVYPEGIKGGLLGISSWNAGWCCGYASSSNIDDVGFINALLDTLIEHFAIDTNKIYAAGMSNGGFLAYRLACELSGRIAAVASVAASMSTLNCNPQRPVPVISFHSYLDTNVPYEGGIGNGPSNHYNSPQDSVLNAWANMNVCTVFNDTIINNSNYTEIKWTNCDCSVEIHQYITQDGGHSWPGGIKTAIGDPVSNYIHANDLMWAFFQQYSLACSHTSSTNATAAENLIKIYPNPTDGIFKIQTPGNWKHMQVSIFDPQGKEILRSSNQTEIDISNLSKGLFFIKIEIDDMVETNKILKTE